MVSSQMAQKFTGYIHIAFAIGMLFFPTAMMSGYKADTFSGKGATFFQFAMGIMGLQMIYSGIMNLSSAKPSIPKKQASITCFINMLVWVGFFIMDGSKLLGIPALGEIPDAMPREAVMGNLCLFTVIAFVNYLGWKDSGGAMPNLNNMVPKGEASTALLVSLANSVFFGIGCGLFTEKFVEMYTPGTLAALPGAHKVAPMVFLIMGNAGKVMLLNVFGTLAVCSVGEGAAYHGQRGQASYRMLRIHSFYNMVYLGMFARDHIIFSAMGWANPWLVASFVQVFAVTFFVCNSYGSIQVTLKKTK